MKDQINFLKLAGIIISAVILVILIDFSLTAAVKTLNLGLL
ncbi:hypothetical protein SAMN05444483_101723 [Salegentibacter echinorum]|uniref:Uncharacterized protein n=1 Tax=Salegentibacter echinorum TaxID=1073325 RepID=A0A1M5CYG7_SALEC|nr:hypothetical protein [Salegentibacter echinorum]SHF59711.1 hypothetical protein SAMN05444483_101723 [Salegentibacter echinorum]